MNYVLTGVCVRSWAAGISSDSSTPSPQHPAQDEVRGGDALERSGEPWWMGGGWIDIDTHIDTK